MLNVREIQTSLCEVIGKTREEEDPVRLLDRNHAATMTWISDEDQFFSSMIFSVQKKRSDH